jgi:hypothetical protein
VLGIGGGGDVVGALATAHLCHRLGTDVILGGVSWERLPIDPRPGPRSADEILEARSVARGVMLAGPQTRTTGGALFAESHMARLLGEETVLVDVGLGPAAVADGLEQAAAGLGVDLLAFVDVGGDVLGNGREPGLASPLCDAVMLAAAALLQRRGSRVLAAVFGPCCDGELTPEELLGQLALLAADSGLLGLDAITPETANELERAIQGVPTEASAQAVRCARGELGVGTIRAGRRTVPLSPLGATTVYFDADRAVTGVARLARMVMEARDLDHAQELLSADGVRTELDLERERSPQ